MWTCAAGDWFTQRGDIAQIQGIEHYDVGVSSDDSVQVMYR
jgi:hypothetical protein